MIFYSSIHMNTAFLAGMALNGRRLIDNLQLVGVCSHAQIIFRYDGNLIFRYDGNLRKKRALRFPALAATTSMVMSTLRSHGNLDRFIVAVAMQKATGEIINASLYAIVDGGV